MMSLARVKKHSQKHTHTTEGSNVKTSKSLSLLNFKWKLTFIPLNNKFSFHLNGNSIVEGKIRFGCWCSSHLAIENILTPKWKARPSLRSAKCVCLFVDLSTAIVHLHNLKVNSQLVSGQLKRQPAERAVEQYSFKVFAIVELSLVLFQWHPSKGITAVVKSGNRKRRRPGRKKVRLNQFACSNHQRGVLLLPIWKDVFLSICQSFQALRRQPLGANL